MTITHWHLEDKLSTDMAIIDFAEDIAQNGNEEDMRSALEAIAASLRERSVLSLAG